MMSEFLETYIEPILLFISGDGLVFVFTVKYIRKTAQANAIKAVQDVYQEIIVHNDISLTEDKRLSGITGRVSESFIKELLSVDIVHKKYDTEKEIDKETKKYPVIEETTITIQKNRDKVETDSIH